MRRALALTALLAGCGETIEPEVDAGLPDLVERDLSAAPDLTQPPFCTDQNLGDAGLPPTLANVQFIFDNTCVGCHCCGDAVDLTDGRSWASIVNRAFSPENSVDETCGGTMVTPFDPAHSYLYQKLTQTMPCAGQQMPVLEFSTGMLPDCQLDLIRRWIESGAPQ